MFGLNNRTSRNGPMAHRQEIGGGMGETANRATGLAFGLVAGTQVATAMGWRPVEAITLGDLVLTFDRGLQPVRSVSKGLHWGKATPCPTALQALTVPAGALGNQDEMTLMPEQSVLVESDTADALFGDPFTLIGAAELDGFRGITRVPPTGELDVIQLHFDADEIVFVGRGALTFCPGARMFDMDTLLSGDVEDCEGYRTLPRDEAAMLIRCLEDEDCVSGTMAPESAAAYAAAFA